jgi:DNA oxidative demethylase
MKSDGTKKPALKRPVTEIPGVQFRPGYFDAAAQRALLGDIREVLAAAPYFLPTMPRTGKPFSVAMSNCGSLGWVSDKAGGYRYQATHPETGQPWPKMPQALTDLWHAVSGYPGPAEACLINFYDSVHNAGTKMGSHVDRDEADFTAPVVSVSLGDDAVFHIGGLARTDPKSRVTLRSGAAVRWPGPPLPSRYRPRVARHQPAAARRRAHQPNDAAGNDVARSSPGIRSGATGINY